VIDGKSVQQIRLARGENLGDRLDFFRRGRVVNGLVDVTHEHEIAAKRPEAFGNLAALTFY
jgi:hypothetical protein